MQLPFRVIIEDEKYQFGDKKIISFQMEDPEISTQIKNLGVIPELNYLNGMMFRLQEQFELDPNQNIIIEGAPNDLTYLFMMLWFMQNGSIGFENEEDGNCKFIYRGNINNEYIEKNEFNYELDEEDDEEIIENPDDL
jgi:hypothetical protein